MGAPGIGEAEPATESDLDAPGFVNHRGGKRGRRASGVGRPEGSEAAAATPRKRTRQSVPTDTAVGVDAQVALTSPSSSQKVQGRLSVSGVMVSVKDGRVLSRHLELKKAYGTGYRNILNTNT